MLRRTAALTLTALIVPAVSLRGEDAPVATAAAPPLANESTDPESHASSAALSRNIASSLPKFQPKPQSEISEPENSAAHSAREPAVMLPRFLVREPRPIEENDVATAQAKEDAIVKRYVGKPSGLDVALNKFTLNILWKKIPLLGPNSDFATTGSASLTYGQRITLDYSKIEARRKYIEALGVSADVPPAKPAPGKKSPPEDGK